MRPKLISIGGNAKLGATCGSFNLEAGSTCPGASTWCMNACYAQKGFFTYPQNQTKYANNLIATQEGNFVTRVVEEIRHSGATDFRIHSSGDFYDVGYVERWTAIAKLLPWVHFWAYTRSWRLGGEMLQALAQFRALPNVSLYASVDDTMHDDPPEGWPTARTGDILQLDGGTLCPNQTSGGKVTCVSCRLCIEGAKDVIFISH